MNVQEEIEKAFKAGAEYLEETISSPDDDWDCAGEIEINDAATEYINKKVGISSE
jgi:hypothetical protein